MKALEPCRDPDAMPQLSSVFGVIEMRTYASPADAQLLADGDGDATVGSLVRHLAAACTLSTSPPVEIIILERPEHATGCLTFIYCRSSDSMTPAMQIKNPLGVTIIDAIELLSKMFRAGLPAKTAKRFLQQLGDESTGTMADFVCAQPRG